MPVSARPQRVSIGSGGVDDGAPIRTTRKRPYTFSDSETESDDGGFSVRLARADRDYDANEVKELKEVC